jgi:peptidoglycan/LPS O-acetylase OafA/YrhL
VAPDRTSTSRNGRRFRADIQGLRAVAVSLVVVYHLVPASLTGGFVGVDVFFVISGFLITSHLVSKLPRNGADLVNFWRSRIRRLLPASLLVILAALVASRLVAPATRWHDVGMQAIASALYVQNWTLSAQSVDYLAAENAATALQHFWSLSVEEQFYLVWPVLILAAGAVASRRGLPALGLIRVVVVGVFAASLLASVILTAAEPASAYFVTPTRMWELAAGGLVAVFPTAFARLSAPAAGLLAWVGIGGVVAAAVLYDGSVPFPGVAALLPVLSTALVIGVAARARFSPAGALGMGPVQWLGDVSYSVYLWHWPLIVLVPYVSGGSLGALDRTVIVITTLLLAAATKAWVEDPFRRARVEDPFRRARVEDPFRRARVEDPFRRARVAGPSRTGALPLAPLRFALAGMVVISLLAGLLLLEVRHREQVAVARLSAAVNGDDPCFGAAALHAGADRCPVNPSAPVVPTAELAARDKSAAYADDCWTGAPYDRRRTCTYGDGPTQVALVGNSHAGQWLPALQPLADELGLTITTYLVSQCNASDAPLRFDTAEKTQGCLDWGRWAQGQTQGDRYDLVITSERNSLPVRGVAAAEQEDAAVQGYAGYLARWSEAKTKILIIKDTPDPGRTLRSVPDCVAANAENWAVCSGSRSEWASLDPLVTAAAKADDERIQTVDLTDLICDPERCNGVTGGVVTYFDASHLTATYAATLAPYLRSAVQGALD